MAQSDSQGAQSGADKKIEPLEIHAWRRPYVREKQPFLLESEMPSKDPFEFFDAWFREVSAHGELSFEELNAAALSTVSDDGWPSCRIVLIKAYGDTQGFSFYTNYGSQKAKDLAANPRASILFHWPKVHWQVRIMGPVEQLSDELADQYWQKRPFDSQIGSAASEQSTVIASRDQLLERAKCLRATAEANKQTSIPRPKQWGGYVLRPRYFEFWQGQTDRLHDRIRFRRRDDGEMTEFTREGKNGWVYERLSP